MHAGPATVGRGGRLGESDAMVASTAHVRNGAIFSILPDAGAESPAIPLLPAYLRSFAE